MKNLKTRRLIYVVLSVIALVLNALPIVIKENAAFSQYSIISVAFALCSVIYAVIAFIFKFTYIIGQRRATRIHQHKRK